MEATVVKVGAHARRLVLELTALIEHDLEGANGKVGETHRIMEPLDVVLLKARKYRCHALIVLFEQELLANVLMMIVADLYGSHFIVQFSCLPGLDQKSDLVADLLSVKEDLGGLNILRLQLAQDQDDKRLILVRVKALVYWKESRI